MIIEPPKGFKVDQSKIPFEIGPNKSTPIYFVLKGSFPEGYNSVNGYFRAVIDEDTEAQPIEFSIEAIKDKTD